MNDYKNFGVIKYTYDNEVSNFMKEYYLFEPIYYGIYFLRNNNYYTISFSFFGKEIVYFVEKIVLLKKLLKLLDSIEIYPVDNNSFLNISEDIIHPIFYKKFQFTNFNFSEYIIKKIFYNLNQCNINTTENKYFDFYFDDVINATKKLSNFNNNNNKINKSCIHSYHLNLKNPIILNNNNKTSYDHKLKYKNLFNLLNKYIWLDKSLYLELMKNYLINNNFLDNKGDISSYENDIKKIISQIETNMKMGFINTNDIYQLIKYFNEMFHTFEDHKKNKDNSIFYLSNSLPFDNSNNLSDSFFFTEENEIKSNIFFLDKISSMNSKEKLMSFLKFINSIYQSQPNDKYLIALQNTLVDKLSKI